MHRPGVARVSGDRILLERTTIAEVRDHHKRPLELAVEQTNRQAAGVEQPRRSTSSGLRMSARRTMTLPRRRR